MKFENYHDWTPTTAQYPSDADWEGLSYAALGLSGEIAELMEPLLGLVAAAGRINNQVKKVVRDDQGQLEDDRQNKIADELGDVFWYLSQLCHRANLEPAAVMERNWHKLMGRLGAGTINGDRREEAEALFGSRPRPSLSSALIDAAEVHPSPALAATGASEGSAESFAAAVAWAEGGGEVWFMKFIPDKGAQAGRTIIRGFVAHSQNSARLVMRSQYGHASRILSMSKNHAEVEKWSR